MVSYIVHYSSESTTYGRVRSFFCAVLLVPGPVFFRSSANTAVLVRVHPAGNPYPKGNFLSAERSSNPWYHACTPLPRVPLVHVSQRRFFLSRPFDTSTCSCDTWYDISASQQINYLVAPPCVCSMLCKHVLCCCTTLRTV